jgi:hypothetical protein
VLHFGDFSPQKKRREKKTAVQEWKLENANNEASGEDDKKTLRRRKGFEKKWDLIFDRYFFLHPRDC